ncbi:hypothetical protein P152DRAFT_493349 [Eremomyces bilateralis CBS 781.70]|uniref:Ribonucleases P/MRP subunit Pop8-like domain-containing protein n=1 Tax=Eremomyces bilateralis CBS 781.70 TaxID=1392243 RepID=A0A6G1FWC6_9PEZI|nr:uncharacterized protein P152DRAFT_493349 [Eremomyces bilateralis CBS 781.70]KAF1810083.1 hypothetical protein P152DRAFT_493349 [Eremomyces bilateralis CBS 781.70]
MPTTTTTAPSHPPPTANPSRRLQKPHAATQLLSRTLHPTHTYLHLRLLTPLTTIPSPTAPDIDPLTIRTHLTSALRHAHGLAGTAIALDVLKVKGEEVWVRCPAEEGRSVVVGLGGWEGSEGKMKVGWRVVGWDGWAGRRGRGDGRGLFL